MADYSIDPNTRLGPIHLIVPDLQNSLSFYRDLLGMRLFEESGDHAMLGAGETPIVALRESPGARPRPPQSTGLYHFAILLPSRPDLARILAHLAGARYPIGGASDHLVSEALYLDDPDGIGIEIYTDRPRSAWPWSGGSVQMATNPLDVEGLMAELKNGGETWRGMADGTRLGHIHLHVADLPRAEAFYHDVLGFDLTTRYGSQAAFLSAGGYHHHVGINTWAGVGAPPPPANSTGLDYFTVMFPNETALDTEEHRVRDAGVSWDEADGGMMLRDPSGNAMLLTSEEVTVRRH